MKTKSEAVPVAALVALALLIGFCADSWISTGSPALAVEQAAVGAQAARQLTFHRLPAQGLRTGGNLRRSKIPGGWLVALEPLIDQKSTSMVFIPDPDHEWDGSSLP